MTDAVHPRIANFRARDAEYKQHIEPDLVQAFKPRENSALRVHSLESGHKLRIRYPDAGNQSEWSAHIWHESPSPDSDLPPSSSKEHAVNLGTQPEYVPQRLREFMTGRHGAEIMGNQMAESREQARRTAANWQQTKREGPHDERY